uniref:Uncharacterized protein n=1 Tax=Micrurus carvalhoi TaxID=3147026 RepID=A0A2H6NF35_9SAUR
MKLCWQRQTRKINLIKFEKLLKDMFEGNILTHMENTSNLMLSSKLVQPKLSAERSDYFIILTIVSNPIQINNRIAKLIRRKSIVSLGEMTKMCHPKCFNCTYKSSTDPKMNCHTRIKLLDWES